MIDNYEIKLVNNEQCLFLHISNDYELSNEFFLNKSLRKSKNIYDIVINFIKKYEVPFNGKKVFLVFKGVIIGSIILTSVVSPIEANDTMQYVEYNNNLWEYNIPKNDEEKVIIPEKEIINDTTTPIVKENPKVVTPKTNPETTITPPKETIPVIETKPIEPIKEELPTGIVVTLYRYNGTIEQIALEDYVVGVVGAEMPALFNIEALKAQSIAARTYALKRITENKAINDSNANQIYKDTSQLQALWGANYNTYYNKIKSAASSTKDEYIAYNNYYIDALYFSTSNGKTEDPIYVWGNSFPYLKSVDSHWDLDTSTYLRNTTKSFEEASKILGFDITKDTTIEIVSKTTGDRVNEISINNNIYSGIDIRDLFGLRSSDFDIDLTDNNINFVTRGYGHGVGMSQYGANGMAKEGYTYKQILNHYYPNTEILTK